MLATLAPLPGTGLLAQTCEPGPDSTWGQLDLPWPHAGPAAPEAPSVVSPAGGSPTHSGSLRAQAFELGPLGLGSGKQTPISGGTGRALKRPRGHINWVMVIKPQ